MGTCDFPSAGPLAIDALAKDEVILLLRILHATVSSGQIIQKLSERMDVLMIL